MNRKRAIDFGILTLKERAEQVKEAMIAALESANNEEKSSAGDKYETGRAMGMLERERLNSQLQQILKDVEVLSSFHSDKEPVRIGKGSLIEDQGKWIFIGVGLGKYKIENEEIWYISASAPLARKYMV